MKPIEIRYKADRKRHSHSDFYPYLVVFDEPTNPQAGTIHQCLILQESMTDTTIPAKASWAMPGNHLGELISMDDLSDEHRELIDGFINNDLPIETKRQLHA